MFCIFFHLSLRIIALSSDSLRQPLLRPRILIFCIHCAPHLEPAPECHNTQSELAWGLSNVLSDVQKAQYHEHRFFALTLLPPNKRSISAPFLPSNSQTLLKCISKTPTPAQYSKTIPDSPPPVPPPNMMRTPSTPSYITRTTPKTTRDIMPRPLFHPLPIFTHHRNHSPALNCLVLALNYCGLHQHEQEEHVEPRVEHRG